MKKVLTCFCAMAILFALLTACGQNKATTMRLVKIEGTVDIADGDGKEIEPREDLMLANGYGVNTASVSYAWINLDDVKLTKMDADSEIAITRDGKMLALDVKSGSLFFNITKPLEGDEALDIRTSSMMAGIRGTCGWVEVPDADHMNVYIIEGTVECTAGENSATVTVGEMAAMNANGDITVKPFYREYIPNFIAEENLEEDMLQDIPSIYPITVLTRQTLYSAQNGLHSTVDYFYDEKGYALRKEEKVGPQETYIETYSYDSERHCWRTDSNGDILEWSCVPGNTNVLAGCAGEISNNIFSDPMVTGLKDNRSQIGPDGYLELGSNSSFGDFLPDGYYAIYTMDENGYPVNIETYSPEGILTGTATLEWTVIDP